MSYGPFKGTPVKKAKFAFRDQMVGDKQAFVYSEPEKKACACVWLGVRVRCFL